MSQQAIPQLRFPEFTGEWQIKQVEDSGKFVSGGTPSKNIESYWQGNIPWVSSSDIPEEDVRNIFYSRYITDDAVRSSATKLIPANSLLVVSRVGVGKLAVNDRDVCTSQDFINIIPNKTTNIIFLAYLLKNKRAALLGRNQGTSIKGFTRDTLAGLLVSIPSMEEQKKIADFLIIVDDRVTAMQQKLEILKRYKMSVMQKIFTRQIRFKDTNNTNYSPWEKRELDEVADNYDNKRQPISSDKRELGEIPYYGANGVVDYVKGYIFEGEYVLIAEDGVVDVTKYPVHLVRGRFWANNHTHVLKAKAISNTFLFHALCNIKFGKYITGSAQTKLNGQILKRVKINIPHAEEQHKIADFLTAIDDKIKAEENKLAAAKTYKKALLQGMFV
jgi:type I restriction enzyme S subunit